MIYSVAGQYLPMSQAVSNPPNYLTFEEYLAYDNSTDGRYELVNGVLVKMPPESDKNLEIARKLLLELIKHIAVQRVA